MTSKEKVFELKSKNILAKMVIINNKYIVLKESTSVMNTNSSSPQFIVKLRQELIEKGVMVNKGEGFYTFTQDATFNSPSYAAAAIIGNAANGRKLWRFQGKMLKEIDNAPHNSVSS